MRDAGSPQFSQNMFSTHRAITYIAQPILKANSMSIQKP